MQPLMINYAYLFLYKYSIQKEITMATVPYKTPFNGRNYPTIQSGGGGDFGGGGAGGSWEYDTPAKPVVTTVTNPTVSRLAIAGLSAGGVPVKPPAAAPVTFNTTTSENDWRIRVSLSPSSQLFYLTGDQTDIMYPLLATSGVIFPYTPTLTMTHNANYSPQKFTHSNYPAYSYENSEVQAITLGGDFTVQNKADGAYLLACIYFFRAVTKMFFGSGDNVGNPPPLVFLDGYGTHYLPHVPCIVTSFTHTMPAEVDYVSVPTIEGYTRLPTNSTISVTLQPVYSKKIIGAKFNLTQFAQGKLLKNNGGFI